MNASEKRRSCSARLGVTTPDLRHQPLLARSRLVSPHAPVDNPPPDQPRPPMPRWMPPITSLETAVKLNAGNAESHALLGTLYGMKINGSMLRAIRFGPSVQHHQEAGIEIRRGESPCPLFVRNRPVPHRQGCRQPDARRSTPCWLRRSCSMQKPSNPRRTARATLGIQQLPDLHRAHSTKSLGQTTEAADYYRKALAAHPCGSLWPRKGLKRLTGK